MSRRRAAAVMAVAVTAALGGACCNGGPRTPPAPEVIERGPAPSYEEVARRYNERVADLSLIWAQSVTRIWYTDREGRERSEQADAYLQHVAPHNVRLEINRLGNTYAILGANDEFYWWIDLAGDEPSAIVGRHDQTTPEAAARAGLPVHPLDLLALIGAAPLAPEPDAGEVWWSGDGRQLILASRGRWGRMTLALDPESLEPQQVEMTRGGEPAVASELSAYVRYDRRSEPSDVRLPGEVIIHAHESGARLRMSISRYLATSRNPNRNAYDLAQQLQSSGIAPENIRRVEDSGRQVSQPPAAGAGR